MKKIFLFASAILAMGLTSCDINDVENIGEMSSEVFPATEEDAEAVLAGVYQVMNETMADPQSSSFLYYSMLASDDQLGGGGTNDKLMQAVDEMLNSETDMTNNCYSKHYTGISRANVLIGVLAGAEGDVKKQAYGEALAMRAFYYYELASMYGNVPLVRNADEADAKQGDVHVLWGQILQDLRDAIEVMPAQTLHNGHLDKYTVEALLGRAWLFYTGMYGNGDDIASLTSTTYSPLTSVALPDGTTMEKSYVVEKITDCANNSGYELVPDFRNLWAYTNKCTKRDYPDVADCQWVEDDAAINPESMFAIKFNKWASWDTGNTIGFANGIALHIGVRGGQDYGNTFPYGQGWGAGPVSGKLMEDWANAEPNDKRRAASVQDWDQFTGNYVYNDDFVQATRFHTKKWSPVVSKKTDGSGYWCTFECEMFKEKTWPEATIENFQLSNIHDLVMLRYAEVLLMHSELTDGAPIEKLGKSGLNAVRERAGLPEVAYSLKALQDERRWEFAGEAIRWNDMRRWHIAADALEAQEQSDVKFCQGPWEKNKRQGVGYRARYNATAGFAKMPETQVSLGVVAQNPGWEGSESNYGGWVN